ncbi:MAG TPA: hypothetical protein VJY33_12020 [Isosphaeraceae bacterium]|nr:hypothetical protein [Isosphaeraceae bacterium]
MAELTAADRAEVVQHLAASARWLALLGSQLAEQGETEAADLVEAGRADIGEVCQRLSPTASAGT